MMQRFMSGSWIRTAEHTILRVVSLVFSMASAYAIRLFFMPLDAVDAGEVFITWAVAVGFGVLGYVVSRGLVHRMMNKENIWGYAPICLLVELVDIACNYVLAASVVRQAWWLQSVPADQRGVLTFITYVVLSAIPLVSLFLAVVDMDLERSKAGVPRSVAPGFAAGKPLSAPRPAPIPAGKSGPGVPPAPNAAARRASYWNNQQTQAGPGARNLVLDPDKDTVGAGTF